MTWAALDDAFYDHPSIIPLSLSAVGLWVKAIGYANRHLTDGYIPIAVLMRFGGETETDEAMKQLLQAGRFIETDRGIEIRGFLKHNRSREQVKQLLQAKVEAGRKGGLKSGESRRDSALHSASNSAPNAPSDEARKPSKSRDNRRRKASEAAASSSTQASGSTLSSPLRSSSNQILTTFGFGAQAREPSKPDSTSDSKAELAKQETPPERPTDFRPEAESGVFAIQAPVGRVDDHPNEDSDPWGLNGVPEVDCLPVIANTNSKPKWSSKVARPENWNELSKSAQQKVRDKQYAQAFADGFNEGRGTNHFLAPTDNFFVGKINAYVLNKGKNASGNQLQGDACLQWLYEKGVAFGRYCKASNEDITAFSFENWHNNGERAEKTRPQYLKNASGDTRTYLKQTASVRRGATDFEA